MLRDASSKRVMSFIFSSVCGGPDHRSLSGPGHRTSQAKDPDGRKVEQQKRKVNERANELAGTTPKAMSVNTCIVLDGAIRKEP